MKKLTVCYVLCRQNDNFVTCVNVRTDFARIYGTVKHLNN